MHGHTYSKSMVANPARGQLNRENEYPPVRVRAREFGLTRRVRQFRVSMLISILRLIWCLRGRFLPSSATASIYIFETCKYIVISLCVLLFTVCVCVFFPVKFVGCTSRGHTGGRTHGISHSPSFCGSCLFFLPRRIQPFLSIVGHQVEFCVLTI